MTEMRRLPFLSVIEDDMSPADTDLETYRSIRLQHATKIRELEGEAADAQLQADKWLRKAEDKKRQADLLKPKHAAVVAAIRIIEDEGE